MIAGKNNISQKVTIDHSDAGKRLDIFVSSIFPEFTRGQIQKFIKEGKIFVTPKKPSKASYTLKNKDEISIEIPVPKTADEIQPEKNISFKIVYKHKDFLVINKPAGLSAHPSENEKTGTLANGLLHLIPEIKNVGEDPSRPGIVHRLDKDTSGLMIVPLNQDSFLYFKKLFQEHKVTKKYIAIVWGKMQTRQGEIATFIGRSLSNPIKQATNADPRKLSNPKEALTGYEVIKRWENASMVELSPKTGRKHQIRIHMHSIGHPLVGDQKYQHRKFRDLNKPFNRHLLHAWKLSFEYQDGKKYSFISNTFKQELSRIKLT